MLKSGCTGYATKWRVAQVIGIPVKKLSDSAANKVLHEFRTIVAESNRRPAIEQLYAEHKLNEGNVK